MIEGCADAKAGLGLAILSSGIIHNMNELHHDFTQDAAPARAANGGGAFQSAAPAGAILRGKTTAA